MPNNDSKIVIGIPSYNEEDTISCVTKQVDLGLKKFYSHLKSLIINVDSNSTDNTKEVFLKTSTFSPKKYLNTGKKFRGKGKNLIELFKFCKNSDIDYLAVLDSDIRTIKPNWIYAILNPIMTEDVDYTTPVYSRSCYDGNVTNNFAIPLTYATFGVTLQQPIGGEFGLNKKLYRYLLKKPIDEAILGFGIDIFMTYHAIGGGFKVSEVYLGEKKHRPGFSTLTVKFLDFSQSAIKVTKIYKRKGLKIKSIKQIKDTYVYKAKRHPNRKLALAQLEQYKKGFWNNIKKYKKYLGEDLTIAISKEIVDIKNPSVSSKMWIESLAKLLNFCYKNKIDQKLILQVSKLILPIFYWRAISFWQEMKDLNPQEISEKIKKQSILLRNKLAAS